MVAVDSVVAARALNLQVPCNNCKPCRRQQQQQQQQQSAVSSQQQQQQQQQSAVSSQQQQQQQQQSALRAPQASSRDFELNIGHSRHADRGSCCAPRPPPRHGRAALRDLSHHSNCPPPLHDSGGRGNRLAARPPAAVSARARLGGERPPGGGPGPAVPEPRRGSRQAAALREQGVPWVHGRRPGQGVRHALRAGAAGAAHARDAAPRLGVLRRDVRVCGMRARG
jgi:hypothetical protein